VDPLFLEDAVNKEVNAVNSEYEIDVASDGWRIVNLLSVISDKKHPASRFTIGSTETLAKKGG
jgi:insulysin